MSTQEKPRLGQHFAWCPTGMERANADAFHMLHFVLAEDFDALTEQNKKLVAALQESRRGLESRENRDPQAAATLRVVCAALSSEGRKP